LSACFGSLFFYSPVRDQTSFPMPPTRFLLVPAASGELSFDRLSWSSTIFSSSVPLWRPEGAALCCYACLGLGLFLFLPISFCRASDRDFFYNHQCAPRFFLSLRQRRLFPNALYPSFLLGSLFPLTQSASGPTLVVLLRGSLREAIVGSAPFFLRFLPHPPRGPAPPFRSRPPSSYVGLLCGAHFFFRPLPEKFLHGTDFLGPLFLATT